MSGIETFEDLTQGIGDDMEAFVEQLNAQITRIVNMLNDAASGIGGFLMDIVSDTVDDAIDRWNNEIFPWIQQTWQTIQTNVWDAVGDLAGRPMALLDYAHNYSSVKPKIYVPGSLTQKMVIFEHDWTGYAANNYKAVATIEDAGLSDLSQAFDSGATLTTAAASKILTLWRNLAAEFLGWTADLLGCFKVATGADAIITFELPAAFELAKAIWQKVIDIANLLAEFMVDQATSASMSWQQLASGASGLPGNRWPMIEESNSDAMNKPNNWAPAGG